MHRYDVIVRPILTEKSDRMTERHNQYVFEVDRKANKRDIRRAVERLFDVSVTDVRTMIMPGKSRRWGRRMTHTAAWKKAVVTLADDDSIDVLG